MALAELTPIAETRIWFFTCIIIMCTLAACVSTGSGKGGIVTDGASLSSADVIAIGATPIQSVQFHDATNRYVLALLRRRTIGPPGDDDEPEDRIELRAVLYRREAKVKALRQIWEMKDAVDCDGLDIEADFFQAVTAITDLDDDGLVEVTFAYKMFCGGGVDPYQITVVMRNGSKKYLIEGESLVTVKGNPPFGGGRKLNAALLSAPQVFKDFMDKTWRAIYMEHIP